MTETQETVEVSHDETPETPEEGVYELGYHIIPSVAEEELPAVVARVKDVLAEHGAVMITEGSPQKIRLAYVMEKAAGGKKERFDSAYFGWMKCTMTPENADAAQAALQSVPEILRFLLIKSVKEAPTSTRAIRKPQSQETPDADAPALTDAELNKTIDELVGEGEDEEKEEEKNA